MIESIGEGVTGLAVGDRVATVPGFSQNRYGSYTELMLVPAGLAAKYPESLSFVEASTVWMMFITAYGGLVEKANLVAGETVVIPGASSGVGLAAIQIANSLGAIPIALTRSSAKRQQLLDAGAAFVIATEEQDLVEELARITKGKGVDVLFDPVAGPTLLKLFDALAGKGGRLVIYGALSTQKLSC